MHKEEMRSTRGRCSTTALKYTITVVVFAVVNNGVFIVRTQSTLRLYDIKTISH
jgi:flagellar basal body L-ring protein FlgH